MTIAEVGRLANRIVRAVLLVEGCNWHRQAVVRKGISCFDSIKKHHDVIQSRHQAALIRNLQNAWRFENPEAALLLRENILQKVVDVTNRNAHKIN